MSATILTPEVQGRTLKESGPQVDAFASLVPEAAVVGPSWLLPLRRAGLARFAELGFPTTQHEDWRFTNVAPVAALPFRPTWTPPIGGVSAAQLEKVTFAGLEADRLVFVDGHFSPDLSRRLEHGPGVVIESLKTVLASQPGLLEPHLKRLPGALSNAFTALNDAYFTDGAVVLIPAGQRLETPVHLLFVSTGAGDGVTSHLRTVIDAGARSEATIIESFVRLRDAATVTTVVTGVEAGESAVLEHLRFQDESVEAFHLGALQAVVGRSASLLAHSFALGARLSRQNINAVLNGEGLEAILNGLYLTAGDRLADHHMIVDHASPRCASHEYFNGVLAGKSRGVFHGRILVRPDAQKTDAKQTNKNVLLSDDATVNTKPQLEIYADDVKCTHGATVGQMNPESVFYLRCRGIPLEIARRMLIHSFAGEIIDRVRCSAAREELDRLVWDRLEEHEVVHVGAHV
ncbi:MAG: Fe-S cluster assembly protein SufD [Limisphaerales bacterium]